jgi:hypothetical protein
MALTSKRLFIAQRMPVPARAGGNISAFYFLFENTHISKEDVVNTHHKRGLRWRRYMGMMLP